LPVTPPPPRRTAAGRSPRPAAATPRAGRGAGRQGVVCWGRPPELQSPRQGLRRRRNLLGSPYELGVQAAREMAAIAPSGVTPAHLACRWILDQDGVSGVIRV